MGSIIEKADQRGDFVTGDDGYVIYWPEGLRGGFSAEVLRELADELDKRNAAWDKQVQEDMR